MKESNLSLKELKNLEEVDISIDKESFEVNEGICKDCNEKLTKMMKI